MHQKKAQIAILLVCSCWFSINVAAPSTPPRLVLVCSVKSPLTSLSHTEVRKLFLGVPVEKHGVQLIPLRNTSDTSLTEVFLQKVIFMSKRKYEHQLVTRVFRYGGVRPKVYKKLAEIVDELQQSPEAVTYMWSNQLVQADGIKSIGVLWESSEQ